jgi:hypothetical protein
MVICKGPVKSKLTAGKTRAAAVECIVNENPGNVPTCGRRVTRHSRSTDAQPSQRFAKAGERCAIIHICGSTLECDHTSEQRSRLFLRNPYEYEALLPLVASSRYNRRRVKNEESTRWLQLGTGDTITYQNVTPSLVQAD